MPLNNDPQINVWNRLEPRPRRKDFSRALRAEVRDSLWYLSRQWQFGEFKGEDTGSAIHIRVDMETTRVDQISLKGMPAKAYNNEIPMETQVERIISDPDLSIKMEMGRHWLRMLNKNLLDASNIAGSTIVTGDITTALSEFKLNATLFFVPPVLGQSNPEFYSNQALRQTYATIGNGRAIDGYVIYLYLKFDPINQAADYLSTVNTEVIDVANSTGAAFVEWFEKTYNLSYDSANSAWDEKHLEYNFACSAPASAYSQTVLTSDEYYSGKLDWYNFDIETDSSKYDPSMIPEEPDANLIRHETLSILPKSVTFPGMPRPRWWEFEDSQVNFGNINVHTTDIGSLLFMEFALIYSNDWIEIPYAVPVGSLCKIQSMVVKDVFGQLTQIHAAGAGNIADWQRWSMYTLHTRGSVPLQADTRLFIPPVNGKMLEAPPMETVNLMRDEMANMVWGVETIVPDGLGGGMQGFEAAGKLKDFLKTVAGAPVSTTTNLLNDAAIRFNLMSSVPENWIPFIPVKDPGLMSRQIQLQRAAMPRIMDGIDLTRIRPRTQILRVGLDDPLTPMGYKIHEEEVPRSGAIVSQSWQRTRWHDGRIATWIGRKKTNGRGEGNSGLRFDQILPKNQ